LREIFISLDFEGIERRLKMYEIKEFKFRIMGKVKAKQSVKFGINGVKYTPPDMVTYANWVKTCLGKSTRNTYRIY